MTTKSPNIKVVGAYRVAVDEALVREAMDLKYPLSHCSEEQRQLAQAGVIEQMASAVLVEIIIDGAGESYTADDFSQPGSDQAAYMETYLSRSGDSVLSEYDRPEGDYLRVAFFLHYFDAALPVSTSYGDVTVPTPTEMPERLSRIIRYEPVD